MQQYPGQPIDLKPFKQTFIVCALIPEIALLLAFVLWSMQNGEPEQMNLVSTAHLVIFGTMTAISVVAAPLVRGAMLRRTGQLRGNYGVVLEGEPAALARVSTSAIVGMALFEMPVLSGFVLGYLAMSWSYFIPGAVISAIGWAFMYPRPSQIRTWYARQMEYVPHPHAL